ncbi:hypothetical protein SAMN05216188_12543 [Lentzea xinjiangensis]|uniref:Uncharacterized protein n=1 Tax=Lentzea xinjiangensis TaxID=402600 RepID=A0A1H9V963_9PSEU|nr:hypothetical protein [Lentzea xinjiangensis]SES18380.1 hypothetical protein SAMN05216188_12543 [Lentzea xinjiangensis]
MTVKPGIPPLDPMRVQVRKHALLKEISTKPSRRWWRFAVPATALAAAAVVGAVLWTPTQSAYASWTAEPRAPGPDTETRVERCREQVEEMGTRSEMPFAPAEAKVVDQRGDLTLVLFAGPQSRLLCLATPNGQRVTGSVDRSGVEPLGSAPFRFTGVDGQRSSDGTEANRMMSGMVGPQVGKIRVDTADGRRVTATIANGWVVAWWPGWADATLITLYDHAGDILSTERPEFE